MEITVKGKPTLVEGPLPAVGDVVSTFSLKNIKGETVTDETIKGQVTILSVFPDIATSVCDQQTRSFNEVASNIEGIRLVNVSKNTAEELNEWCAAKGLDIDMWTDTDGEFAKAFGVLMPELDKLARSVFVLTEDNEVAYRELVPEMAEEPNYDAAVEAAKDLL
ncbi:MULTISPECIES: thiol peroxidase [unclassified Jeotgalibaca]|uniref:thiol peroxidase n=1 Tax=unclassified Jeotgalibaca TaxID=2621505 RepID=UPI003FD08958